MLPSRSSPRRREGPLPCPLVPADARGPGRVLRAAVGGGVAPPRRRGAGRGAGRPGPAVPRHVRRRRCRALPLRPATVRNPRLFGHHAPPGEGILGGKSGDARLPRRELLERTGDSAPVPRGSDPRPLVVSWRSRRKLVETLVKNPASHHPARLRSPNRQVPHHRTTHISPYPTSLRSNNDDLTLTDKKNDHPNTKYPTDHNPHTSTPKS